jgi:hypothetical protein
MGHDVRRSGVGRSLAEEVMGHDECGKGEN